MDKFEKIIYICSFTIGVIILGLAIWLVCLLENVSQKRYEEYQQRINSHYVEVHFKDGNVQQFNKNIMIDVDSTRPFGKGELFYVLKPSGAMIPYDLVKYAEVKEIR